jgi:glutathione S-transferase
MQLYYSENLNPRVAVAVARYLEAPVELVRASPRNPKHEDAFRAINPNTLVPVLVEKSRTLWETDAIACRLAMLTRPDFWPTGELAPELQMWVSWSTHHFTRAASVFYWEYVIKPLLGGESAVDTDAIQDATGQFHRFAKVLDDTLSTRSWLVGNRLTYADFRVATALPFATASRLPVDGYPRIIEWHERLSQLPAWSNPFAGLP